MRYLPHTPDEIQTMLDAVGQPTLEALFDSIPDPVRLREPLAIADGISEPELMRLVNELSQANAGASMVSFLGAGAYHHHFPAAADQLLNRSEFYTAYTPYQPEVAQGTLQVIFEFQTIVSEILGLPVANASMYDASTGVAEAVMMARRLTKRKKLVLSMCVHPQYRDTIATFLREVDRGDDQTSLVAMLGDGKADTAELIKAIDDDTACVVIGYPGYLGTASDLRAVAEKAHAHDALLITVTLDPFALALLESPGGIGADIAVAEGQPLGLPPQYGGPGVGLFACRQDRKFLQQLPGRLCGETVDQEGKRGYVLTLSTREQHIRRERATSNICTNSGLCATALTIKMCMLGKSGFVETAEQCLAKCEYLKSKVAALPGFRVVSAPPTFNEFAVSVRGGRADAVLAHAETTQIIAGLDLGRLDPDRSDQILLSVTERHSKSDLDRLVEALGSYTLAS